MISLPMTKEEQLQDALAKVVRCGYQLKDPNAIYFSFRIPKAQFEEWKRLSNV